MKSTILAAGVLGLAMLAAAQGKGGGRPAGARAGQPSTAGRPADIGMGRPAETGRPADTATRHENHGRREHATKQQELKDSQLNGGSWKMLQTKSGKTSEELKAMYASSGAKNYGQFVSAVIVSKNLGLDTNAVLSGLKTKSLGQTLQDLGVPEEKAKSEIKKAKREAKRKS